MAGAKAPKEIPSLEEVMVNSQPTQTLDITVGKDKGFTVVYRALSWLDKSSCVAKATEFFVNDAGEPQSMFHIDIYFREALKIMVVEWPYTMSDKVLDGLSPEVGLQLQTIIPRPLGEDDAPLEKGSDKPSKAKRKTRSSKDTQ